MPIYPVSGRTPSSAERTRLFCAVQVLEALMRCSSAEANEPIVPPADTMLPSPMTEPDQALKRTGLGALERVVASCPGVPRTLPVAARAEASDF